MLEHLPGKLLTRDQLLMLQQDNVVTAGVAGLGDLGIVPTPMDLVVPAYLRRYRPGGGTPEYGAGLIGPNRTYIRGTDRSR